MQHSQTALDHNSDNDQLDSMMHSPQNMRKDRKAWLWPIFCLLALAFGAAISWIGYLWVIPLPDGEDRFSLVGEPTGLRALILYVLMIIGMLSRGIHDYIQNLPRISFIVAIRSVIRSSAFVTAILVSPIVFFVLYNATKSVPDDIVSFLLAFQNGFFWQTVLEKRKGGAS